MQWDTKRRTLEEIVRLINAYLPKEWALVLINLSTSVQAITQEGFMESRILTLDGNGQRSTKLSDWICEHEGVHFQYPLELWSLPSVSLVLSVLYMMQSPNFEGKSHNAIADIAEQNNGRELLCEVGDGKE